MTLTPGVTWGVVILLIALIGVVLWLFEQIGRD